MAAKPTAAGKSGRARGNHPGGVGNRGGRHHGGGYKGFKSKKQWRWAWANKEPWADKKSHETSGGPKVRYRRLPESKHSGNKGSRVPAS